MERASRLGAGSVAVAGVYALAQLAPVTSSRPDAGLTLLSGLALGVAIVCVAARTSARRRTHFTVWLALVFLNLAAVAVEGTLFAPEQAPPASLPANLVRLLAGAAAIAAVVAVFFGRDAGDAGEAGSRAWYGWLWRVLAAAAAYVVLYLVIGGINYTLVTRPYYDSHAAGVVIPAAATVLLYEPLRGVLIALSVLPLILALRARTRTVAVVAGTLLFVAGGLAPLLPEASLPLYLRVASLWEILGQNFLTGVVCAVLFSRAAIEAGRPANGPRVRSRSALLPMSAGGDHRTQEV